MSAAATMREQALKIPALDGYQLDALLLHPAGDPAGAIVVNGATGVPKGFYRRFASYAAGRGYAALLYDYRGTGGSRPPSLRGFDATLRAWGQQDIPGALAWLQREYAGLPLFALGHSAGGQLLGLTPAHRVLRAAAFVAVSTGYWRGMPLAYSLYSLAMLRLAFPLSVGAFGYLPARRLGLGEDLPAGVAREWADWCMRPGYLADFFGKTISAHDYDAFRAPLLWLSLSDDPIATPRNVASLQGLYRATTIDDRRLTPRELGLPAVGHLGFFREGGRAALWPLVIDWLAARA